MRRQGIIQFYLPITSLSTSGNNHTCVCLHKMLVLIYRPKIQLGQLNVPHPTTMQPPETWECQVANVFDAIGPWRKSYRKNVKDLKKWGSASCEGKRRCGFKTRVKWRGSTYQFGISDRVKDKVFRFEIAIDDAAIVNIDERFHCARRVEPSRIVVEKVAAPTRTTTLWYQ